MDNVSACSLEDLLGMSRADSTQDGCTDEVIIVEGRMVSRQRETTSGTKLGRASIQDSSMEGAPTNHGRSIGGKEGGEDGGVGYSGCKAKNVREGR